MKLQPSPITPRQWKKVLTALLYSAGSGFTVGFLLGLDGVLRAGTADLDLLDAIKTAVIVGGGVGAANSLAVTVKQLFTPAEQ